MSTNKKDLSLIYSNFLLQSSHGWLLHMEALNIQGNIVHIRKSLRRSRFYQIFYKTDILSSFAKFTGIHLYRSLFFWKKSLQHKCFPMHFGNFFGASFKESTSGKLLLESPFLCFLYFSLSLTYLLRH